MARVEIIELADRSELAYGTTAVRVVMGGREVDIRLEDHAEGDPLHLIVNERLASGGIRRLVTERVRG